MKSFLSKLGRYLLIAIGLAASVGVAHAAIVNFNGSLIGPQTFNRPVTLSSLSGVGTAVHYQAFGFTVDITGAYTLETTSANFSPDTPTDTFIILYAGNFNPLASLTNAVALNDDIAGISNRLSRISNFNLTAFNPYTLVVTSFDNGQQGHFTGAISGPGTASFEGSPVPVPASLLLVGLGLVGIAVRSRKL